MMIDARRLIDRDSWHSLRRRYRDGMSRAQYIDSSIEAEYARVRAYCDFHKLPGELQEALAGPRLHRNQNRPVADNTQRARDRMARMRWRLRRIRDFLAQSENGKPNMRVAARQAIAGLEVEFAPIKSRVQVSARLPINHPTHMLGAA